MRIAYAFAVLAALAPIAVSADVGGSYSCRFGGMMGSGSGFWLGSIITTVLVWLVLGLLAAYLWKKIK